MENKIAKTEFVGSIAYILLVISAFLPWVDITSFSLNYSLHVYGYEGNGNFLIIFGILGFISLVYGYMYYNRKLSAVLMVIFSVLSLLVLAITYNDVDFSFYSSIMTSPGTGFFLAGLSSIALFLSGILQAPLSKKDSERNKLKEGKKRDRYCPGCGREIPFDAKICPYCKKDFEE